MSCTPLPTLVALQELVANEVAKLVHWMVTQVEQSEAAPAPTSGTSVGVVASLLPEAQLSVECATRLQKARDMVASLGVSDSGVISRAQLEELQEWYREKELAELDALIERQKARMEAARERQWNSPEAKEERRKAKEEWCKKLEEERRKEEAAELAAALAERQKEVDFEGKLVAALAERQKDATLGTSVGVVVASLVRDAWGDASGAAAAYAQKEAHVARMLRRLMLDGPEEDRDSKGLDLKGFYTLPVYLEPTQPGLPIGVLMYKSCGAERGAPNGKNVLAAAFPSPSETRSHSPSTAEMRALLAEYSIKPMLNWEYKQTDGGESVQSTVGDLVTMLLTHGHALGANALEERLGGVHNLLVPWAAMTGAPLVERRDESDSDGDESDADGRAAKGLKQFAATTEAPTQALLLCVDLRSELDERRYSRDRRGYPHDHWEDLFEELMYLALDPVDVVSALRIGVGVLTATEKDWKAPPVKPWRGAAAEAASGTPRGVQEVVWKLLDRVAGTHPSDLEQEAKQLLRSLEHGDHGQESEGLNQAVNRFTRLRCWPALVRQFISTRSGCGLSTHVLDPVVRSLLRASAGSELERILAALQVIAPPLVPATPGARHPWRPTPLVPPPFR
jgi:hypothetical protein